MSTDKEPDKISNKKIKYRLYAYMLIPWPIAGYAIFAAFSNQYSILLSAIAVIVAIILVLYYRKKIKNIIESEIQEEIEEEIEEVINEEVEETIDEVIEEVIEETPKELKSKDSTPKKYYSNYVVDKKHIVQGFAIIVIVYGAIAGLALTQAMIDFSDQCGNEENASKYNTITKRTPCFDEVTSPQQLPELISNDQMLLVMNFFIIGTAFYHCGIMFLYPQTLAFIGDKNTKLTTANCLLIFTESVILFFAATSSDSIEKFSLWIIILLFLDTSWCLLNFFYKDKHEIVAYRIRLKKQLNALYLGWAHLEGLMLMFFITTLIFLTSTDGNSVTEVKDGTWIHIILLLVSAIVIIAIYEIGWEWFWAKFKAGDG